MTKKHDILWLETTDSTNDEAGRRISDIDNLSVIAAMEQTSGRGQGEHTWLSKRGMNLLFSIVLKFGEGDLPAKEAFMLSRATSVSLVKFLSAHGIEAWIKPPNDIYVGERKICGTLIENTLRGAWVISSIIGIGLNVNQRNFDVSLPNPTSMVLENEKAYDIVACLEEFLNVFGKEIPGQARNDVWEIRDGLGFHCGDDGGGIGGVEDGASSDEDSCSGVRQGLCVRG